VEKGQSGLENSRKRSIEGWVKTILLEINNKILKN